MAPYGQDRIRLPGVETLQGLDHGGQALVPSTDPGVFDLKIDGEVKALGRDGGTTDSVAVDAGRRTVSESRAGKPSSPTT